MYNSQLLYNRINEMVKKRKKSMDELNAECNFSKNTVSSSAKSQDGMKALRLLAIAEFLDCSLDYLLRRIDNPEAHKPQSSYVVNNKDPTASASPNSPISRILPPTRVAMRFFPFTQTFENSHSLVIFRTKSVIQYDYATCPK